MKFLSKFYLICIIMISSILLVTYNSLFLYIIMLFLLILANLYFIKNKFADIRYVFLIIFFFYNVTFPIGYILNVLDLKFYSYNPIDYKNSLLLSCLFLVGFLVSNLIVFYKERKIDGGSINANDNYNKNSYYFCIILLIIGIIGYLYFIKQNAGSLSNYFKMSRYDYVNDVIQNYLPLVGNGRTIIFPCCAFIIYYFKYLSRFQKLLFLSVITFYVMFEVLGGNRLYFAFLIVTIFLIIYERNIKIAKIKKSKIIIAGLICLILFQFIGKFRDYFPLLFNNNITVNEITVSDTNKDWINIFKDSEFNGPYYTLITSVSNNYKNILHGASYAEALLDCVPNKLRFNNYTTVDMLRETFIKTFFYYSHYVTGAGLGFSPVAEAYINSGEAGVFFSGFLFCLIFGLFNYATMNKGLIRLYYYCAAFISVDFNRISLLGILRFYFYMCIFLTFILLVNRIITRNTGVLQS